MTGKLIHKAKFCDYEILTDGKKYYVRNYWDNEQNIIYECDSFKEADWFISGLLGIKQF